MDAFFQANGSIMDKIFNDFLNFEVIPILNQEKLVYQSSENKHYAIIDIMFRIINNAENEDTPSIVQAMEIALNDNVPNINIRRGRDGEDEDNERDVRQRVGGRYRSRRKDSRKKSKITKRNSRKKSKRTKRNSSLTGKNR